MRKSLGDKRREISAEQIRHITDIYRAFKETEQSKIFVTTDFGYRKVTVERPLQLNFQANSERIERLKEQAAFQQLAISKKKDAKAKAKEEAEGRKQQKTIMAMLSAMPTTLFKARMPLKKNWTRRPGLLA